MRIGIVNDMRLAVEALRRVVVSGSKHEVAWLAYDGEEAVRKCREDTPDVILMDLIMPVMDGVEATRRIMTETPTSILVVTATVSGNAEKVFAAMGHGAMDAVCTPVMGSGGDIEGGADLLHKIDTLARLVEKPDSRASHAVKSVPATSTDACPMVAVGASTGGPKALADLFASFPESIEACVTVVQHVDPHFAPGLCNWLAEKTPMQVTLAREGDKCEPRRVFLAGSDDHLVVGPDMRFHYTHDPADNPYRPSVDVFFESLASHWSPSGAAILLTGMGRDGASGLLELRNRGWHTIAQDRETCVIYGMPRAAVELKAATRILPLSAIADNIVMWLKGIQKE